MESYKFNFQDKTYELKEENCLYLLNDEENEVKGIEVKTVLELLKQSPEVSFERSYYDEPCEKCLEGKAEKAKYFSFLEYYFYIFTKDSNYVISNISKEFENTTFTKLLAMGKVDNSYVLTVLLCPSCGSYSLEIQQCDM